MNYKEIKDLICKGMLECAISKLKKEASSAHSDEIEGILTTYSYMKEYMLEGVDDSQRKNLFGRLLCQTYELLNAINTENEEPGNPGIFYQKLRVRNSAGYRSIGNIVSELETYTETIALDKAIDAGKYSIEANKRHESNSIALFDSIWTNTRMSNSNIEELKGMFESGLVPTEDKILAIGAIMMSLLATFDIKKYLFIIDCCNSSDKEIKARATVVFLIASYLYDDIIPLYTEATDRIKLLEENPELKESLTTVIIQFLKTLDTKTIDKKFKDEIIPELMRKQKELKDKMGNDLIDENSFNEMNPEWQADMENSPLAKKIKEIGDLQQEGFDVYMGTFAQLKTFPFFRETANWFYPFTTSHSQINSLFPGNGEGKATVMSSILKTRSLCDSDKYSFCFMLTQVPESQRGMLTAQMDAQIEQQINDSIRMEQTANDISNTYIQNLYRFHNLNSHRAEFKNVFNDVTKIAETRSVRQLVDNPQSNLMIAEFLFKNSHYMLSYPYYQKYLAETECTDDKLYQRIGYNAQRLGLFDEAIKMYTTADSISPNNAWVLSHLALCYTMTGDMERALDFYRLIQLMQPDNMKITLQTCKCLIKDGQYRKATDMLYKIYFEQPENASALRMLGWCMFETGNRTETEKLFSAVKESGTKMTPNDHANLAHALWINGKARNAMTEYAECLAASPETFESVMKDDAHILNRYGINDVDIMIMKDMITSKKQQ